VVENDIALCRAHGTSAIDVSAPGNPRELATIAMPKALSELESSMSKVQVEQKIYEMPPREGCAGSIPGPLERAFSLSDGDACYLSYLVGSGPGPNRLFEGDL
jgi:hypothetical protein